MTRLTQICLHKRPIRKSSNYRVTPLFKQIYTPRLNDTVSTKGANAKSEYHRNPFIEIFFRIFESSSSPAGDYGQLTLVVASPYQGVKLGPGPGLGNQR